MATSEGSVTFPSEPGSSYRYRLAAEDQKIGIWLENKQTKYQWKSNMLTPSELESEGRNALDIPIDEYFVCFTKCLEKANEKSEDGGVDLLGLAESNPKLFFWLNFKSFTIVKKQAFRFPLDGMVLSEVELLKSKVHDLEDNEEKMRSETRSIKQEVACLKNAQTSTFVGSIGMAASRQGPLKLNTVQCNKTFFSIKADGSIQFKKSGTYGVCCQMGYELSITLKKDGKHWSRTTSRGDMPFTGDTFDKYKIDAFLAGSILSATINGRTNGNTVSPAMIVISMVSEVYSSETCSQ